MSNKSFKGWLITSGSLALAGVICFIVKFIELGMRTEHDWAQTFVILGIVFLALAVVVLLGVTIASSVLEKKNANKPEVTDDAILAKYKSKKNK